MKKDYREIYDKIKSLDPKSRGLAFEKLINKIFDDSKLLIKNSYFTENQSQQIDGAIELNWKIFLLEAKWEESDTLAASKLYSFLGKINSKIEGTLGIFISHERLKDNFINAIRDGLRQNCILIHGAKNIEDIIDKKVNLPEYIWYCFQQASTKNIAEVNTSEFVDLPQNKDDDNEESELQKKWIKVYNMLTGGESVQYFAAQLELDLSNLSNKLINVFPSLSINNNMWEKLKVLINKLLECELTEFSEALVQKFTGWQWREYSSEKFLNLVKGKLEISESKNKQIINNITESFDGDWDKENDASRIFDAIYKTLTLDNKKLLAEKYLEIKCDKFCRKDKFEQKQFAKILFEDLDKNDVNLFDLHKDVILKDLKSEKKQETIWKLKDETDEDVKKYAIDHIIKEYDPILKDKTTVKKILSEEYDLI